MNVFLIERFQGRLLKLLESPTEESLKIWTPTFLVGLKYSSVNYIEEKILPQALKMIDFSHVSLTRFTGTQIIVQILNVPVIYIYIYISIAGKWVFFTDRFIEDNARFVSR